jgi:hypothetical protein
VSSGFDVVCVEAVDVAVACAAALWKAAEFAGRETAAAIRAAYARCLENSMRVIRRKYTELRPLGQRE